MSSMMEAAYIKWRDANPNRRFGSLHRGHFEDGYRAAGDDFAAEIARLREELKKCAQVIMFHATRDECLACKQTLADLQAKDDQKALG